MFIFGQDPQIDKKDLFISMILQNTELLFHDQYGEPFAVIKRHTHNEIWPICSKSFKRWACRLLWDRRKIAPGGTLVRDVLNIIEGYACFDGPIYPLHNRVTWSGDSIYYDLSDSHWRAVKISKAGWDIVNPPVLFRRYAHQKAQVEPVQADINDYKHLLLKYFNLKDEHDKTLLLVTVVTFLIPDIPHPVWVPYGPPGSTKSTMLRIIKELVDPSRLRDLAFPSDHQQFVQQMSHHYFCSYDNVSRLAPWISDALCRCITGTGFSKRKLYSNDDDIIYNFKRCLGINGINIVPRNADLLERSILSGLSKPHTYIPEGEFWKQFQKDKPRILGALFTIISKVLAMEKMGPACGARMADYLMWGQAVAQVLSYGANAFKNAYFKNCETRNIEALEAHPVGPAIQALMRRMNGWKGKPSQLLTKLEEIAEDEKISTRNGRWPKSPSALSRRLNEVKVNLEDVGIWFEVSKSGDRTIRVWKMPSKASMSPK